MNANLPSIVSLQEEQSNKINNKNKIYNIILSLCSKKIKDANKTSTICFFEVPTIIIGHPNYSFTGCIKFLMSKLLEEKYIINYVYPNILSIDWGKPVEKLKYLPNWIDNKQNLKKQTKKILKKYPDTKKIEYIFTD